MRRSPRLKNAPSRTGDGTRPPTGPALPPQPHTPQKPVALEVLFQSIDDQWHFGLARISSQLKSPVEDKTPEEKTHTQIGQLFFRDRPALYDVVQRFNSTACGIAPEDRLNALYSMVRSQMPPPSRARTPASARTVQPPRLPTPNITTPQTSFIRRLDNPETRYATAAEPGTLAEEIDNNFHPPSPTPSFRRKQASPRFIPTSTPWKRRSDSSSDSPVLSKLTKVVKDEERQRAAFPPPLESESSTFKIPTIDMARSHTAAIAHTTTTSLNTSFNTSFNDSVSSSQQTRADTVNTSFTSFDGASEHDYKMTRTSSAKMGSLDNDDLLYVGAKLGSQSEGILYGSSQDGTRESTSTYGSIDELALVAAEDKDENFGEFSPFNRPTLPKPAPSEGRSPQKTSSFHAQSPARSHLDREAPQLDGTSSVPPHEKESPSRKAWYIRELPKQDLFVGCLPEALLSLPYHILFICCRIAEANGLSIAELAHGLDLHQAQKASHTFWAMLEKHPRVSKIAIREPRIVWSTERKCFEGFTFKGKLVFTKKSAATKSVFELELLPIQAETSCQLQRQFGSDRLLYLTVPPLYSNKPERFTHPQMQDIQSGFNSWLLETHSFLGRRWRVFHIQPVKKKGEARKDDTADLRLVLFAIDGIGIERPLHIGQMLNDFIPLDDNKDQNFCKALARIGLGLSKTTPTLTFKPSQIRRKPDTYSDGTAEATEFNDPRLSWHERPDKPPVMNDGCSRMSVGAALKIWNMYREATHTKDAFPSAMQGRIGGAKGMWIISGEPQSRNPEDLDIWIEVTDSQLKFEPPWEDQADERPFNKHRLTFNLVKYSHATGPTDLHISFIPILIDRGVPRDVVAKLMTDHLDNNRKELLDMVSDPVRLFNGVTKQSPAETDPANVRWQAALPVSLPDKIKLLLRSGFNPEQAPYLAKTFTKHLANQQAWAEQKLRAPLGKATFMYGVTDPTGLLRPGEVHVQFSTPFFDEYTGISYRNLNGLEVLLARQPACRRSDIQKVRVVSRPELSHLVDCIVFPTRGEYPLAGKLQGGDYDGDIFWTCWEDCLVQPFRNAPAPMTPPDPEQYRIKTDRRPVHEVMNTANLSTVDGLLKEGFKFRMAPSLLGKATNFLEMVAYQQNRISSPQIDALCDVHDLLVDAAKQAYIFTEKDYTKLIRFDLKCGKPKKPAYKEAMEANAKAKENEQGKPDDAKIKHKKENVLDYLFFDVFHKHNIDTMTQVKSKLCKEDDDDPDLQLPYLQLRNRAGVELKAELEKLVRGFPDIQHKWNSCFANSQAMSMEGYLKALDGCYESFRALQPPPSSQRALSSEIEPLLYHYYGPSHPVTWETIRASAFYCTYPKKHSLVWHMAGRELARLKARSLPGTHDVVAPIFASLKPKPLKTPKPEEDEDGYASDEEFEGALEQPPG